MKRATIGSNLSKFHLNNPCLLSSVKWGNLNCKVKNGYVSTSQSMMVMLKFIHTSINDCVSLEMRSTFSHSDVEKRNILKQNERNRSANKLYCSNHLCTWWKLSLATTLFLFCIFDSYLLCDHFHIRKTRQPYRTPYISMYSTRTVWKDI